MKPKSNQINTLAIIWFQAKPFMIYKPQIKPIMGTDDTNLCPFYITKITKICYNNIWQVRK